MDELTIDTVKLKNIGTDIVENCQELDSLINDMFDTLNSIPNKNIWVGLSSQKFFEKVLPQRKNYLDFNKVILDYGNYLITTANKFDTLANNLRSHK